MKLSKLLLVAAFFSAAGARGAPVQPNEFRPLTNDEVAAVCAARLFEVAAFAVSKPGVAPDDVAFARHTLAFAGTWAGTITSSDGTNLSRVVARFSKPTRAQSVEQVGWCIGAGGTLFNALSPTGKDAMQSDAAQKVILLRRQALRK